MADYFTFSRARDLDCAVDKLNSRVGLCQGLVLLRRRLEIIKTDFSTSS